MDNATRHGGVVRRANAIFGRMLSDSYVDDVSGKPIAKRTGQRRPSGGVGSTAIRIGDNPQIGHPWFIAPPIKEVGGRQCRDGNPDEGGCESWLDLIPEWDAQQGMVSSSMPLLEKGCGQVPWEHDFPSMGSERKPDKRDLAKRNVRRRWPTIRLPDTENVFGSTEKYVSESISAYRPDFTGGPIHAVASIANLAIPAALSIMMMEHLSSTDGMVHPLQGGADLISAMMFSLFVWSPVAISIRRMANGNRDGQS